MNKVIKAMLLAGVALAGLSSLALADPDPLARFPDKDGNTVEISSRAAIVQSGTSNQPNVLWDLTLTGDLIQGSSGLKINSPASTQSLLYSTSSVDPSVGYFIPIGSTGPISIGLYSAAISTTGAVNGQQILLISTASAITIRNHTASTPSRVVLSSTTWNGFNVSTYTVLEAVQYGGYWFQKSGR